IANSLVRSARPEILLPFMSTTMRSSTCIMPLETPVGVAKTRSASIRTLILPSLAATQPFWNTNRPIWQMSSRYSRSVFTIAGSSIVAKMLWLLAIGGVEGGAEAIDQIVGRLAAGGDQDLGIGQQNAFHLPGFGGGTHLVIAGEQHRLGQAQAHGQREWPVAGADGGDVQSEELRGAGIDLDAVFGEPRQQAREDQIARHAELLDIRVDDVDHHSDCLEAL